MNIEAKAAVKAAKPLRDLAVAGALLVIGYIAVDTHGFTKPPSWWQVGITSAQPVLSTY
jgi:hypothetical protein